MIWDFRFNTKSTITSKFKNNRTIYLSIIFWNSLMISDYLDYDFPVNDYEPKSIVL